MIKKLEDGEYGKDAVRRVYKYSFYLRPVKDEQGLYITDKFDTEREAI